MGGRSGGGSQQCPKGGVVALQGWEVQSEIAEGRGGGAGGQGAAGALGFLCAPADRGVASRGGFVGDACEAGLTD